jgi:hypothetical protein
MITFNGFRKKKCILEGNHVVIDGDSHFIKSIEEANNYKMKAYFLLGIMVILTLIIVGSVYMGFQEQVIRNPNSKDGLVKVGFLLFNLALLLSLWVAIIKYCLIFSYSCRSFWLINGKGVYIENNDDLNSETNLREIKAKIACNSNETIESDEINTTKSTIRKIVDILWLIVIVILFSLVYLGNKGYIKDAMLIPLIISDVILIFILRIYDIKTEYYDRSVWKK